MKILIRRLQEVLCRSKKNSKSLLSNLLQLLIISSIIISTVNATIRYVSPQGSNQPPYTSWETAANKIQDCINISVSGDTIYVANGIYQELVVMKPGLSLIGSGMDSCIIDGRSQAYQYYDVVTVKDSCLFKGFQVIVHPDVGGSGIKARGMAFVTETGLITMNKVLDGSVGIYIFDSDVTVENNILNQGIGILVDYSSSLVKGNYISSTYEYNHGIEINDLAHLYSPVIVDNYIETTSFGIISILGPRRLTVMNNIIVLIDESGWGISIGTSDTAYVLNNLIMSKVYPSFLGGIGISNPPSYVYNNLVFGKQGSQGTGIHVDGFSLGKISNNLIVGGQRGIYSYNNPSGSVPAYYNNIWKADINFLGFTGDSTNLSVDPMIVNDDTTQGELDFHLQMYSPLIDAGDPGIVDKDSTRSDIGLYGGPFGERYIYVDLPPRAPVNLSAIVQDGAVTLSWNKNTEADAAYYNVYMDTVINFTIDTTKLVSSQTDTLYIQAIPQAAEKLYFKVTAVDRQGNESKASEEIPVILISVRGQWEAVNNYMLYQNYPNPFNPTTKISYKLKEGGYVKLYVYDVKGEVVTVLVNQSQGAGYYEVEFPQSALKDELSSGVYIYQIMVRDERGEPVFSDIKKMVYVK